MFEKMKFWKKEPGFGLGKDTGGLGGLPPLPSFDQGDSTAGLGGTSGFGSAPEAREHITVPSRYSDEQMSGAGGLTPVGLSAEQRYPPRQTYQPASSPGDMMAKDLEIISSKLDAIRTAVDALTQRVAMMEQRLLHDQKRGGW